MRISIQNVSKAYGDFPAVDGVSVEIPENELVALLGPSGSGKTTLLRVIAGLESNERGRIYFDGQDVTDLPVRERGIGFVFQHYALFSHMTVFENVAFGPQVRRADKRRVRDRVRELLSLMQLEGYGDRLPSQLSGGQRQRVALARALAPEPRVLLLDEPFGALDARVRQDLRQWIRKLHDEIHVTSLFVTHDQEEAFEVADRVVIMNQGRVEQVGTPDQVFDHPQSPFVMDFLGCVNVLPGRVTRGHGVFGALVTTVPEYARHEGEGSAYIRSHEIDVARRPQTPTAVQVTVSHLRRIGPLMRLSLSELQQGPQWTVDLAHEHCRALALGVGDTVFVSPRRVRVFLAPRAAA